jgi:pyrroline-5-carboxylate reductase
MPRDTIVLSMMAGVPISCLAKILPTTKITRAMPNLGASVGESATGYYGDPSLSRHDLSRVEAIISSLGKSWMLEEESLLDAFTAVAGSGPAYLCWLGEQIEKVAVSLGFSPQDAHAIALETFRGTTLYLEQSGVSFAKLREQVTSPAGTTAAALSVLEQGSADTIVQAAISAAERRARELGKGF